MPCNQIEDVSALLRNPHKDEARLLRLRGVQPKGDPLSGGQPAAAEKTSRPASAVRQRRGASNNSGCPFFSLRLCHSTATWSGENKCAEVESGYTFMYAAKPSFR